MSELKEPCDIEPLLQIALLTSHFTEAFLKRAIRPKSTFTRAMLLLCALLLTCGCGSIRISTYAAGVKPPLCSDQTARQTVLVLWGCAWRENQKEVPLREEIASRAIARFFSSSSCYESATIAEPGGLAALMLTDGEMLQAAQSLPNAIQKVIVLRIEELGPFIRVYLSPILWEGGTDITLQIRLLEVATASLESDLTMHWTNGGPFVLRGRSALEDDLVAALTAVFQSDGIARKP
jgi:hypothetical protein